MATLSLKSTLNIFKNFIEQVSYGFIYECNLCYWQTLETDAKERVMVNISFPEKLGS